MDVFTSCIGYVNGLVEKALDGSDPMPFISIGGVGVSHQYEVYVCEDPQSVSFSDVSTSHVMGQAVHGLYVVEFNVMFQLQSQRSGRDGAWLASKDTLEWFTAIARAVANDKTLGGLCTHAQPYMATGGTANDGKTWTHVIEGGVRVQADFNPRR